MISWESPSSTRCAIRIYLQVLDLAQIPLLAEERGDDCPIVIGGGPCTYNPEPIADFFDIFYIGEGETQYRPLIDLYKKVQRREGRQRRILTPCCEAARHVCSQIL